MQKDGKMSASVPVSERGNLVSSSIKLNLNNEDMWLGRP